MCEAAPLSLAPRAACEVIALTGVLALAAIAVMGAGLTLVATLAVLIWVAR